MGKRKSNYSKSVYAPGEDQGEIKTHTLSILAQNKPGVMAKMIGLLSGRGYNIDSMTAAETDHDHNVSHLTIVTSGTKTVIDQICAQLEKLVPVEAVRDLTTHGPHVSRELALVKILGTENDRIKALKIAEKANAHTIEETSKSYIFEIVGTSQTVDNFIEKLRPLGLHNVSRSGVAAISLGSPKESQKSGDE